jgi:hypothetical protein
MCDYYRKRDSWATGWMSVFESRRGLGIFLLTTASRPALVSTQPPIQWVPGALSLRIKRPERETHYSPRCSAKFKEYVELNFQSPNASSRRDAQFKHRDNFTFTFTFIISVIIIIIIIIKITLNISWEDADCLYLAQDKNQWRVLLNMVINLRVT